MENAMSQGAPPDDPVSPDIPTDSVPDPPRVAPDRPEVSELVDQLLVEVRELRQQFADKIRYDEVRERQVAGMQEELEAHRRGLYGRILGPVFSDLIGIHDDLTQAMQAAARVGESPGDFAETLASFRDSILETLQRNGVESFTVEGEAVDRARQRVIKVEETADTELDRRVARRLRPGFELDGKVLRPEWVVAYRHIPAPVETTQ
jgi:molecular chaperone GrpE (heat shock protein)